MDELERLKALLDSGEATIRQAFIRYVADLTSDAVMAEVEARLDAGDVEGALSVADAYVQRLGGSITQVFQDSAFAEAAVLAPAVAQLVPAVAAHFDPLNARAADLMRTDALAFIREFTDAQRIATRAALVEAFQTGAGPRASAAAFRDSIGLTQTQLEAVANYRSMLEAGSREALSRDLRDRRFDPTVRRAADSGEPLSKEQVDRMVEAYRKRFLAYRAETIARTQTTRTVARGRREAMMQMLEQSGLGLEAADRTWRGIRDNRERQTHLAMEGQRRALDEPFESPSGAVLMYPGDPSAPPEETVNCRCVESYRIKSRAELGL